MYKKLGSNSPKRNSTTHFQNLISIPPSKCGNYGKSLSHYFDKNFVKVTFLLKKGNTKELI